MVATTESPLHLQVSNVIGTRTQPFEVLPGARVDEVARNLAHVMALPDNVPWSLREDTTARFLQPDRPIGEELGPERQVTLTPRTHLG